MSVWEQSMLQTAADPVRRSSKTTGVKTKQGKNKGKQKSTATKTKSKAMNSFLCFSSKIHADELHFSKGTDDKTSTEKISERWNAMNFREQLPFLLQAHYLDLQRKQRGKEPRGGGGGGGGAGASMSTCRGASAAVSESTTTANTDYDTCGGGMFSSIMEIGNEAVVPSAAHQAARRRGTRPPPISHDVLFGEGLAGIASSPGAFARRAAAPPEIAAAALRTTPAQSLLSPTGLSLPSTFLPGLPALGFSSEELSFLTEGTAGQTGLLATDASGTVAQTDEANEPHPTTPLPSDDSSGGFTPEYIPTLRELDPIPRPVLKVPRFLITPSSSPSKRLRIPPSPCPRAEDLNASLLLLL